MLQATGLGLHLTLWRKWRRRNRIVAVYELVSPAELQVQALRPLAADLGAEYDTLSVLHFLHRRWSKRARNPLSSPRKPICSEAVARLLKLAEVPGFHSPGSFTPADLDLALAADRARFQLVEGSRPR